MKVPELKEIMKSMKEGNEPMTKVDAILSRVREETLAEGMAKGAANASIQYTKKLIELGMPYQQIAGVIDSSVEEVIKIAERMGKA